MVREKLCLDQGWKFLLDDPKPVKATGHQAIYMASKSERGRGVASRDYYDADWEDVTLPHDYQILGEYDTSLEGSHGYLPRKNAWYRRSFYLEEKDKNKRILLIFDGIATHATIWVNGHLMERNFCGYNAIEIDITDVIRPIDEANVIAVRVEASDEEFEGWWYEGAGIYRHVWLLKTEKTAISTWGTYVNPVKQDNQWIVNIETEIFNRDYLPGKYELCHELINAEGVRVGLSKENIEFFDENKLINTQSIICEDPILWDIDNPYLYKVKTSLLYGEQVKDIYITNTGFRTLKFDADKGFFINDNPVKIKGACVHQDHGGLGVALTEQIWELRIKKLKEMGCNAYRCGHTPPTTEFLDLCDQYGLLVMDESRWFETSRIGKLQVENMLKKDRNHPCVFIWSVGNEEPVQSTDVGERIAIQLKKFVKTYDKSRPVTVALNGGFYDSKVSKASDIVGINYNFRAYDKVKELLPDHPVFSPEVGATSNCRGVYFDDSENGRYVAYDEVAAPFGSTYRKAWDEVNKRDFVFGMFIWAGFEYRGESTWPKLFAGGGALDSSGYEKDNFYLFKALWTSKPMIHIMPHWNLNVEEGTKIKVMTYTNGEEVELFLNGKSLGRKKHDPIYQTEWYVPYEKGTLKAIAYKNNEIFAQDVKKTLEGPYHVEVERYTDATKSKDQSTVIFDIVLKDENGVVAEHLDSDMSFKLEGLTLLGTGNGDPGDHDHNRKLSRKIFKGHCQVICRIQENEKMGKIKVSTKEFGEYELDVNFDGLKGYKSVPNTLREWKLTQFWKSPLKKEPINLDKEINIHDVNSWEPVLLSKAVFDSEKGYRHYYMNTKMPSFDDNIKNACIRLKGIVGKVQIRIEHNKNYWPLPEPKEFLKVDRIFTEDKEEEIIPLTGFKKDEAILIHLIVHNEEDISSVESIEWIIR